MRVKNGQYNNNNNKNKQTKNVMEINPIGEQSRSGRIFICSIPPSVNRAFQLHVYVMLSSQMGLKSAKFNFHLSDQLYTFAKLPFTTETIDTGYLVLKVKMAAKAIENK